jgi:hypothetical protein
MTQFTATDHLLMARALLLAEGGAYTTRPNPMVGCVMAQGEDETQLKIGQDVYLRRLGGVYYFTVKSQIEVVQQAFMKLFRRKPAKPAQNSQGSRTK